MICCKMGKNSFEYVDRSHYMAGIEFYGLPVSLALLLPSRATLRQRVYLRRSQRIPDPWCSAAQMTASDLNPLSQRSIWSSHGTESPAARGGERDREL